MFTYKGVSVRVPQFFPIVSGTVVFTCEGEYADTKAYNGLYHHVGEWILGGYREVILVLNGITQVGTEAVTELEMLRGQLTSRRSRMILVMGPDSAVHKSLSASGKLGSFKICPHILSAFVEFSRKCSGPDCLLIEAREIPDTGIVVLDLKGKVLLERGSWTLGDILDMLYKAGQAKSVLLNMADVSEVDSTGLGVIIGAWVSWMNAGRVIDLACLQPGVKNLFTHDAHLHKTFGIHETVEEGVEVLKRSFIS